MRNWREQVGLQGLDAEGRPELSRESECRGSGGAIIDGDMNDERHDDAVVALRETARRAPTAPGVYRWLDADGGVLYVGKAKDLRKRLASYFRGGAAAPGARTSEMVSRARTIEYVVTGSETEALLLEDNFIKEARPPFNLRLRDDKSYPFIEITLSDEWPRVRFFRGRHAPGNLYFGPYSSARKVRETLELIGRIFPYRKCKAREAGPAERRALPAVLHRPFAGRPATTASRARSTSR